MRRRIIRGMSRVPHAKAPEKIPARANPSAIPWWSQYQDKAIQAYVDTGEPLCGSCVYMRWLDEEPRYPDILTAIANAVHGRCASAANPGLLVSAYDGCECWGPTLARVWLNNG